ncbi:MAG TPA: hypothetical protein DFR83_26090, partial [Deltaproteobacteria bacterium]|nr:hypothetical protein [Deltaproteobacteria bacterium]
MTPSPEHRLAACPTLQVGTGLRIRLLANVVDASGAELYQVAFRTSSSTPFVSGTLTHAQGDTWDLHEDGASHTTSVTWASPDAVFALALGPDTATDPSAVAAAAPHWPAPIMDRLVRRRLSGPGTVAFDADWFLAELARSPLDHPLLLPDATSKLGLTGLERATAILAGLTAHEPHGETRAHGLAGLLRQALDQEPFIDHASVWGGEGRLIGEFYDGELAQLGTDIDDGCRAALGTGPLEVVFAATEPMGLGLGPGLPTDQAVSCGEDHDSDSVGWGCIAGEVTVGEAAHRAGVMPGMMMSHLSSPFVDLTPHRPEAPCFEAVLDMIDERRAMGLPLRITFDTAAPVTRLYAVEMPATVALGVLATATGYAPPLRSHDVGVGASFDRLCGSTLIWREATPRLFLGEAGSVTCAHTDICPQVQMAHALSGTKLLGVAAHHATSRLRAEHARTDEDGTEEDLEHNSTTVSTDRPLTVRASRLLCDPEVTIAVLQTGDLAVFDSGALHFAS